MCVSLLPQWRKNDSLVPHVTSGVRAVLAVRVGGGVQAFGAMPSLVGMMCAGALIRNTLPPLFGEPNATVRCFQASHAHIS